MLLIDHNVIQIIMISYFRPNDFQRSIKSVLANTVCPFHLSILDNSHGGLNKKLKHFEEHPKVTVYRNDENIGKGAAFNKWYPIIMQDSTSPYFVSIDADIFVPPRWLYTLEMTYNVIKQHEQPGIIAPAIVNNLNDTFQEQINQNKFIMHNIGGFAAVDYYSGLYRNRYVAGPLFFIDREFFELAGGYYTKQLYGSDDGRLCFAAEKLKRFIGIDSNVHVLHMNNDSTPGYNEWKLRNITKDVDHKGYWD